MTEKRYIVGVDEEIIDTKTNREYTTWDISGVEDICDKLNNLTEENEQLKKEKQAIKNIISKLNNADYYLDSAILDEEIQKIATIVGEEYE